MTIRPYAPCAPVVASFGAIGRGFGAGRSLVGTSGLAIGVMGVVAPSTTEGAWFELQQMAVFHDDGMSASLEPSSGSFVTQTAFPDGEGTSLVSGFTVRRDGAAWRTDFDQTMASTWLAVDRWGPRGRDGNGAYGRGWFETVNTPSGPLSVPEGNFGIGGPGLAINGNNGDPVNGDGLSPGFYANSGGFAWHDDLDTPETPSDRSIINGLSRQSVFVGHFVLSDPNATLVGSDLFAFFTATSPDNQEYAVYTIPLDGSLGRDSDSGDEVPFWLEYERVTFTNSLGTFTALDMYLVPSPAVSAFVGVACLPLVRRRRLA